MAVQLGAGNPTHYMSVEIHLLPTSEVIELLGRLHQRAHRQHNQIRSLGKYNIQASYWMVFDHSGNSGVAGQKEKAEEWKDEEWENSQRKSRKSQQQFCTGPQ